MRKITIVLTLCVLLCMCAVPAFAVEQMYDYGGLTAPSADNVWDKEVYPYGLVVGNYLYVSDKPLGAYKRDTGRITICSWGNTSAERYRLVDGNWAFDKNYDDTGLASSVDPPIRWANQDVYSANNSYQSTGTTYFVGTVLKLAGIDFEDWQDYYGALTNQITVVNVVTVICVGISAIIGIVFMWWGVRKLVRVIMTALKKGRISL